MMKKRLIQNLLFVCSLAMFLTVPLSGQEKPKADQDLIAGIMRGDLDSVKSAIMNGADVNKQGKRGYTPFEFARRSGYKAIADYLVSQGAKTDIAVPSPSEFIQKLYSEKFNASTPACVILISRDGKPLMQKAFGMSNIAEKESATIDHKFRIGSVTKQFTAAAILKLEEEGRLSIEDEVSKYFPEFPRGNDVTLKHLLTHTSGIVSYTSKNNFWMSAEGSVSELEIVDMVKNDEFDFEPGEKYSYCNTGYVMLGYIVGKVTESSLEAYLKKTFFDPLGMNNTGIHRPDLDLKQEANGYTFDSNTWELKNLKDMSWAAGAGAMYSTVGDLHKWNEALFANKVLKQETLKRAFAKTKLNDGEISNYGYGWMISKYRGLKKIEHGGGLPGFLTHLVRYPEINTTIVVFVNCFDSGELPPPAIVAKNVADAFLWESMEQRKLQVVNKNVDTKKFKDFVGEYDYGSATMEVTVEGNQIFAQLTGQPKAQIFPSENNKFFWKIVDAQVEFQRDKNGNVVRAVHTQNGATQKCPKIEPGLKVDAEVLNRYSGRYDYGSGVMTVTTDGKALFAQITGQPKMRIFPKSKTTFEWKVVKAQVEFVSDANGNIEKVIHTQNGRSFDAAKIESPKSIKVSKKKLDEYVGRYNLGFLIGVMEISRDGETMYAKLPRQPKLKIIPTAEDELSWVDVVAKMKLVRDKDGKIIRGDFTQNGRTFKGTRVKSKKEK